MLGRALFVAAAVALPQLAFAGVPAWCGDHKGSPAGANLARSAEVKDAISGIVDALCSPPQSGVGFEQKDRDEVEKLRTTWSQRLLMTEADWADAVEWRESRSDVTNKLSVKSLAAMTPVAVIPKSGLRSTRRSRSQSHLQSSSASRRCGSHAPRRRGSPGTASECALNTRL